ACGGGGGSGEAGPAYVQTLTSVTPAEGSTAGGTQLTLHGRGFTSTANRILGVRLGDNLAPVWEIVDDSTIRLTTPAGPVGQVTIWLLGEESERLDGAILARGFQYVAPTMLVAEGAGAPNPKLYRVDLQTGAVQTVGAVGFPVEGMAMAPEGQIYAIESAVPPHLIRIDPVTGAGEAVALLRDGSTGGALEILDVTFLEGRLVGRTSTNVLVEIDRVTGQTTPVSTLAGSTPGGGLAADRGVVFLAPEDDPSALEAWIPDSDLAGRSQNLTPGAVLEALAASGGSLYGIDGDPESSTGVDLFEIDPVTGRVVAVAVLPPQAGAVARGR
ncbi:MAG: IPT/TIG domain-containing protein, partial [Planctomycetota bacterium]|nr:IPT/TIG domain-containing protein [Planctomycetota bacterium]